jgi:HPt (histidine-containing phosphotransfer) domain-containing protein
MISVPPSFDASALAQRIDDDGLVAELLEEFLDRADGDVATIRRAVLADDLEVVRIRAHAFRGLLATLAADKASRIAADIEQVVEIAPGDAEALTRLVERLALAVERACDRMRAVLRHADDGRQGTDVTKH